MTDITLLVCGASFSPPERERLLAAYPAHFINGPDEMAAVDSATRQSIRAVAYKGHKPFGGDGSVSQPWRDRELRRGI